MYTKDQLNDLYERIVKDISISNNLFDAAEDEYMALGAWLDRETPTYRIEVYAQGSFALGTVNKPITGTDDYDLDLVCEFAEQYELTAKELKCTVIKPLLQRYRRITGDIVEKRRCWHVEYEDVPNFHMDIIPAVCRNTYIDITDHDEDTGYYDYIGSNPRGYIKWFQGQMKLQRQALLEKYCKEHRDIITCQADIEKLKEYNFKTPLQKTIQILKRHRDIMFEGDTRHLKPVSIIITTIAAQLYGNEDNIVDTLNTILNGAEQYISDHISNGEYHIDNPCFTGGDVENFADKWNEHPERAAAFVRWLNKAKMDLVNPKLYSFVRTQMAENVKNSMGTVTHDRVFRQLAEEERAAIAEQRTKVDVSKGTLSTNGSIPVPKNHHYGALSWDVIQK